MNKKIKKKEIGIMFLFFSLFFATMGVLLFFDTGLLAVANVNKKVYFGNDLLIYFSLSFS